MKKYVIEAKAVRKDYPFYNHISGGIKNLLLKPNKIKEFLSTRKFTALHDVNFSISKGEAVAIIGRNGAGKSTLLSLLTGVMKPTSGEIKVAGRVAAMLELGGGFHSELTGRENIIMNATLLGLPLKITKQRLEQIIEFSELGEFIDQPIRTYSSGMLAKLGFSVITSVEPEILIIDEVLAVGDIAFQKKCLKTIKEFKDKGTTVVLVSHNANDVRAFCDRTIWIDNHTQVADGKTADILPLYERMMNA